MGRKLKYNIENPESHTAPIIRALKMVYAEFNPVQLSDFCWKGEKYFYACVHERSLNSVINLEACELAMLLKKNYKSKLEFNDLVKSLQFELGWKLLFNTGNSSVEDPKIVNFGSGYIYYFRFNSIKFLRREFFKLGIVTGSVNKKSTTNNRSASNKIVQ